jgi:hypothetical protein
MLIDSILNDIIESGDIKELRINGAKILIFLLSVAVSKKFNFTVETIQEKAGLDDTSIYAGLLNLIELNIIEKDKESIYLSSRWEKIPFLKIDGKRSELLAGLYRVKLITGHYPRTGSGPGGWSNVFTNAARMVSLPTAGTYHRNFGAIHRARDAAENKFNPIVLKAF